MGTHRRQFLVCAASAALAASVPFAWHSHAQTEVPADQLKPGQWSWYPERSPSGPVAVVVTLSDQLAFVYRNGIRIGVSTVSSGRKGYETPTGVFTVLRKEKMHHSSKYANAPMPDSQFFFGGAALHAGGLPGYPSSHGCVHLPRAFADRVFAVTHNGTPVIVTNTRSGVGSLSHAGLVLAESDLAQIEHMTGNIKSKGLPTDQKGANSDAFTLLASGADRKLYALKNGEMAFESPISIANPRWPLGSHVFILKGHDPEKRHFDWIAVGLGSGHESRIDQQTELAATTRLQIPPDVHRRVSENLHPGSTFMLTDLPAHPGTRSNVDFVIMRDGTGT